LVSQSCWFQERISAAMTDTSAQAVAIPRVDTHLLKFSQAGTFTLTALAFILQWPALVVAVAIILALSAAFPPLGPFRLVYRFLLVPLHILRPRVVEDDPAPHRFAQAVGATFLTASSVALYVFQAPVVGWTLDLIVFALSFINFSVGFCAGCFVYYQLGRIGLAPKARYAGGFHWRGV
jgi:Domain of unknown function (DUF4395)